MIDTGEQKMQEMGLYTPGTPIINLKPDQPTNDLNLIQLKTLKMF